MIEGIKKNLEKHLVPLGITAAIGGFINDVISPLLDFAYPLLIATACGFGLSLLSIIFFNKDKFLSLREKAISASIFFGVFLVVWLVYTPFAQTAPDNGYLASNVPAISSLQKILFQIKDDTTAIRQSTQRIENQVGDFKVQLRQVEQSGGINPNPITPQDYYQNAVLNKQAGKNQEALKNYEFVLDSYPVFIDPYLDWLELAKNEQDLDITKLKIENWISGVEKAGDKKIVI
jgi:tetratricopeptide (TPR) repeat protein